MEKYGKIRVAILYRVIQHWRVPIFERLNAVEHLDVKVFHGRDFRGSKVVNARGNFRFDHASLFSVPIKFKTSNGLAMAPFSPGILFALARFRPHVILCEGASNLPNNVLAYLYAFLFRPKIIQWGLGEIQGRRQSWQRRLFNRFITAMERRADACLAYSTRGRDYYQKIGVPAEDIFVAVNVVDTEQKQAIAAQFDRTLLYEDAHKNADFVVLFVGALTPEKKVDLLLRAFKRFQSGCKCRSRLVIVGDGPDRTRLMAIAKTEGVEHVDFEGQVIEDISKYFLSSDVFVMPGLGGLAVSDAMSHGLPVIASIGDGCEKDLLSFGGGILDESLDEGRLAGYLKDLAMDRNRLNKMKDKASWTIAEKYNIATYMDNVVGCIEHAMFKS